jgi:hypothetical protein
MFGKSPRIGQAQIVAIRLSRSICVVQGKRRAAAGDRPIGVIHGSLDLKFLEQVTISPFAG